MVSVFSVLSPSRIFLSAALALICIAGDRLLAVALIKSSNLRRALVDNGTHGVVGLLSWAIVVDPTWLPLGALVRQPLIWEMVVCGALASLLDLDHFFAAKSLKLQEALSLPSRPPCHATTVIPVVGLVLLVIVKLLKVQSLYRVPAIFVIAWLSHHIRDATRRGLWLWPWGSTPPLPYWCYVSMTIALPFIAIVTMSLYSNFGMVPLTKQTLSVEVAQHV